MDLTLISQNEFNKIANNYMTTHEAYLYLTSSDNFRRFSDTLASFSKVDNIKKLLTDKLCQYMPDLSRNSVAKKVRGWVNGDYEPTDRETCFQICFALGLNEDEARMFLTSCSDNSFHYRNPLELTYAFALRVGMSYEEAVALYNELPEVKNNVENRNIYTETIYLDFLNIDNVEDFKRFFKENIDKLGVLHNTAYRYICEFMSVLTEPDKYINESIAYKNEHINDDKYSIEKVVNSYLRMDMLSEGVVGKNDYIRKTIKKYWPSVTSVKCMLNGSEDVKRKIIVLLYLITEGITDYAPYDYIDDDLTPEETFAEHYNRLSTILLECGFALPDPRNPFDWIVLYAIKMNNSDIMAEEMQMIINKVFNEKGNDAD